MMDRTDDLKKYLNFSHLALPEKTRSLYVSSARDPAQRSWHRRLRPPLGHRLATAAVTHGPSEDNIVVRGTAAYQLVTEDIRQIT